MRDLSEMTRREFLRTAGASAVAIGASGAAGTVISGCAGNPASTSEATGEMTYRTNQANGDKVSILGYGCMRWPMNTDEKGNETIDQEAVNRLVDYAIAHGINYFDTSPVYLQGLSEQATAIALGRYPRESYFLATKLSNFSNYTRDNSILMYRKSFENLRTDYIDYYLLHSIGKGGLRHFNERYVDNGMIDFLMEERKAGRIRNLGFSFHGDKKCFEGLMQLHDKVHWDFVQIQMNYIDWKHAKSWSTNAEFLYRELTARGIPVVIMEPLLGGRLANVPEHIATRLQTRNPHESVASWAFRFAGTPENILCVLSGMTYMEHLQDNLRTFSPLRPLSGQDLEFLEETAILMQQYPTIPCNDCKYCMPCPYGIDIPAILLHYNKCVNEGNISQNPESETYRKARRAYLVSYDRAIPKVRQADRCIGCRKCVEHCPQGINIPKELRRIDLYIENLKRMTE